MFWLLSRGDQVLPPSSERYSAESGDSTIAYTTCGSEGAIVTAIRPYGLTGKPLFASWVISVQVLPPSAERNKPLADGALGDGPPERNVQPLRRKSHIDANSTSGFFKSMLSPEQPVERFPPFNTSDHDVPPSVVLYRPRSGESLHSLPATHAYAVSPLRGSTARRATCSELGRPRYFQVSPPSLVLYTPLPIETELRIHDSPVPTQTLSWWLGSIAIAPIDITGCLSNTGLKVVPLSVDFHTPPLAAPM